MSNVNYTFCNTFCVVKKRKNILNFMDRNKRNDNSLIPSMIFFKALNNDHSLKQ